jgi:glutathione S-transferase
MARILYELKGLDDRRYSLFSWRARLALAHKQLPAEMVGVRVTDKAAIAFSGQAYVPILVDGDRTIPDSWAIATYLEETYPDSPSLFGGAPTLGIARFVNYWVDRQVIPAVAPLVVFDLMTKVDQEDGAHLRKQLETAFGGDIEKMRDERPSRRKNLRRVLDPVRATLKHQAFLCGNEAMYPDYIVFSVLQWARIISDYELLDTDDPLWHWRERILNLFDGLARGV